ncbi:UPF0184 protein AAEL002161 [Maniola hyperantus]|uniref:UPF0184 protein AAEL002161 n=1 Tax=Aphantopus hyperantus TaxID=2795564 RepID=UPI0015689EEE|nr:UPF0184 protein AAEL002161 [Maniola hyperantus]
MAGTDDTKPTENEGENSLETDDELNEIVREEYNQLDSKLDELNQALDMLEQKNDDIHSRLLELLQSNRDVREQLKHQQKENNK